jgi:sugar/nucleoside kinase (ribokinase family)
MSVRHGIIAGGNWIVDRVKTIDLWPPQDSLASILAESIGNGGSPFNILKDLARLGATFPLEAVGLVGDDVNGTWIREECRVHGIDARQLRTTADAPTSYTDVMTVGSTGRRTFFHQRGANALLAPEHFDFSATRAKIFHLGYLLLLDELDRLEPGGKPRAAEVFMRARAAGLRTSLDCVSENSDRFRTVVSPVLPLVDVLFANDLEAEKLTGEVLHREGAFDAAAVERAAAALLASGVRAWVIIHFPEAVYARSVAGESLWQGSVRVPPGAIRGAAGAGDAFAAGVLLGWHDDLPMPRALELGVCAAAASLEHPTCSESVHRAAECLALGQRHGFREPPRAG